MSIVRRGEQQKALERWARRATGVARLQLVQLDDVDENASMVVRSWEGEELRTITMAAVFTTAEEDAATQSHATKYAAIAFGPDDAEISRQEWTVDPNGGHYFGAAGGQRAAETVALTTMKAHADMSARHSTEALKLLVSREERQSIHYEKTIEGLRAENAELRAKYLEGFKLLEELATEKHEREMERLREEAKAKRAAEAMQMVRSYVPIIFGKLGTKPGEPPTYAGEAIVDQLIARLLSNPDRLAEIFAKLEPDEQVLFSNLAETRKASIDARNEHRNGAANGIHADASAAPANDAAKEAS